MSGVLRPPSFTSYNVQHSTSSTDTLDGSPPVSEHTQQRRPHINFVPHLVQHTSAPELHSTATPSRAGQKRAYRQRRKDPSCDACRDRKVKCDATEDKCCSECSGRGVRCQFTKETNRRMSSMRQVQDLHNQLAAAKRQITQLQAAGQPLAVDGIDKDTQVARNDQPFNRDVDSARRIQRNVSTYGRTLLRLPGRYSRSTPMTTHEIASLYLPSSQTTQALVGHYFERSGRWCPLLNRQSFQDAVDKMYNSALGTSVGSAWIGLLYAVLACGAVAVSDDDVVNKEEQEKILRLAQDSFHSASHKQSHDNIILAALLSVYYFEIIAHEESTIWLATAVRLAQGVNLHMSLSAYSDTTTQTGRRIWWCLCFLDRLIALESSLPVLVDSRYCGVPSSDDAHSIESVFGAATASFGPLLSTFELMDSLVEELQRITIPSTMLDAAMARLESHEAANLGGNDPNHIYASLLLQSCRLILYRRRLTPHTEQQNRQEALQECVAIATASAEQVSFVQQASLNNSPGKMHTHYLPSFISRHLWRCILFLGLNGDYSTARALTDHLASACLPGDVCQAYCQHIGFFLGLLRDSSTRTHMPEEDEELLAYASADLQQDAFVAWIWQYEDGEGVSSPIDRQTGWSMGESTIRIQRWEEVQTLVRHLEETQSETRRHPKSGMEGHKRHTTTSPIAQSMPRLQLSPHSEQPQAFTAPTISQRSPISQLTPISVAPVNRISIQDII